MPAVPEGIAHDSGLTMNRQERRAAAARKFPYPQFRTQTMPPRVRRGLLLGASCLTLAVALGAGREAAAADECGVAAPGTTVTCDHDGTPATDSNPYSKGIDYAVADLTIIVTNGAVINTTTKSGEQAGIDSGGNGDFGDLTIISGTSVGGVTITTDGPSAEGIGVRTNDGDIDITSFSRIITSGASGAQGIEALTTGGNVTIDSHGRITTVGSFGAAISGFTIGNDHSVAITSDGTLKTSGYSAEGLEAITTGKNSDIAITSTGNISTAGGYAAGILAYGVGLDTDAIIRSTGDISTTGVESAGIRAQVGDGGGIEIRSKGDITTKARESDGIQALTFDTDIIIASDGDIFTRGSDSDGIDARAKGGGDIRIGTRGTIIVRGTDSDGIFAAGGEGTDTKITFRGSITTFGKEGEGIFGGGPSSVTITSLGNITTFGDEAEAILARGYNYSSTAVITLNTAGVIKTEGYNSDAIAAFGDNVIVTSSTKITTTGDGADGIDVGSESGAKVTSSGKITVTGDGADGISVVAGGDATVTSTGNVEAKGLLGDGIEIIAGGDAMVTTSGKVLSDSGFGAIRVDAGDTANLTLAGVITAGTDMFGAAAVVVEADGDIVIDSTADLKAEDAGGILARSIGGNISIISAGDIVAAGELAEPGQHSGIKAEAEDGKVSIQIDGSVTVDSKDNAGIEVSALEADLNIAGSVTNTGENGDGIRLDLGGPDDSHVTISGSVFGGWDDVPRYLDGAAALEAPLLGAVVTVTSTGSLGALSDQVFAGKSLDLDLRNFGTITGTIIETGTTNLVNEAGAVWELRNFADTDGDGVRDTEGAAISRLSLSETASVTNSGTLRLASADGAISFDYEDAYPGVIGVPFTDFATAGVEQGQLLGVRQFINAGDIDLQDGTAGDLLLITYMGRWDIKPFGSQFVSSGGTLSLDVYLGTGSPKEPTDLLILDNAVAKGTPTTIQVANAGGPGALTTGDGIMVVNVRNASSADAFDMAAPVIAGAYQYDLYFQNLAASDQSWYLRSSEFTGAAAYPAVANSALTAWRADLLALQDHVDTLRSNTIAAQSLRMPATIAGIADGGTVPVDPALLAGGWFAQTDSSSDVAQFGSADFTQQTAGTQFGYDFAVDNVLGDNDWLVFGAFGGEGWSQADFTDADATADFETTTMGAYATWFSGNLHVDALMKYSLLDGEFSSDAVRGGDALTVPVFGSSLGAGYRFDLSESETGMLWLRPSVALDYAHVGGDTFADDSGARITLSDTNSLRGRLGARLVRDFAPAAGEVGPKGSFYFELGVAQELLGGAEAEVSGVTFRQELPQTTFEFGAGFDIALPEEGVSFTFDTGAGFSEGEDSFGATGGVRITW